MVIILGMWEQSSLWQQIHSLATNNKWDKLTASQTVSTNLTQQHTRSDIWNASKCVSPASVGKALSVTKWFPYAFCMFPANTIYSQEEQTKPRTNTIRVWRISNTYQWRSKSRNSNEIESYTFAIIHLLPLKWEYCLLVVHDKRQIQHNQDLDCK